MERQRFEKQPKCLEVWQQCLHSRPERSRCKRRVGKMMLTRFPQMHRRSHRWIPCGISQTKLNLVRRDMYDAAVCLDTSPPKSATSVLSVARVDSLRANDAMTAFTFSGSRREPSTRGMSSSATISIYRFAVADAIRASRPNQVKITYSTPCMSSEMVM